MWESTPASRLGDIWLSSCSASHLQPFATTIVVLVSSFSIPSPLCWCHATSLFIFCNSFKHYSPLGHAETDLFLDDCKFQLSWKTEFVLIGLARQLAIISCYLITHSARSLGFVCDEELIFSDQMSELSCYSHICYCHFLNIFQSWLL